MREATKFKICLIVFALFLLTSVLYNIYFLYMSIYPGEYICIIDNQKYSISFDDPTEGMFSTEGIIGKYDVGYVRGIGEDAIVLCSIDGDRAYYKRLSVFEISAHPFDEEIVLKCNTAVLIQVFLVVIELVSIISVIFLTKKLKEIWYGPKEKKPRRDKWLELYTDIMR